MKTSIKKAWLPKWSLGNRRGRVFGWEVVRFYAIDFPIFGQRGLRQARDVNKRPALVAHAGPKLVILQSPLEILTNFVQDLTQDGVGDGASQPVWFPPLE